MKVAILHDYLNQLGGAERVLEVLLEIFPEAEVYTILYDKKRVKGKFNSCIKKTSFLDILPVRKFHRFFIPLMPFAAKSICSREKYDLVFSSTAGYAKGFNVKGKFHISYCHTPLRYAWEMDYLSNLPFYSSIKFLLKPFLRFLKHWDKKTSKNVHYFIANSKFIAEKIKNYYKRDAEVIYPPVDEKLFYYEPKPQEPSDEFYLMAGRLLHYKCFALGIGAFNKLGKKLKIVGNGPEFKKLKNIAKNNVEFIPDASDADLREFYNKARALIFPQIEDFGLVAAEAQMCGLPVLAYGAGGALEIITDRKTGLFFHKQTEGAIMDAIEQFEKIDFDKRCISDLAKRFSKQRFKDKIKNAVARVFE